MAKKYINDLSDMFSMIDLNKTKYYNKLSPIQKTDIEDKIWLLMRFCSSVEGKNDKHYLIMSHEIVNKNFMKLYEHPELQLKLLSMCGVGYRQKHYLLPNCKTRKAVNKIKNNTDFQQYNDQELQILCTICNDDELEDMYSDYPKENNI